MEFLEGIKKQTLGYGSQNRSSALHWQGIFCSCQDSVTPTESVFMTQIITCDTHLEPDILESEVKWALGSITVNKASGGDGIPVELFQVLKDDAVRVLHSICQQI